MSDPLENFNDAIDQLDLEQRYSDWQSLGQGGMGKVFLAHDEMLDKKVAIKLLHSDVDSRAVIRFQQEAKVLSKLGHDFIVRINDFHYSKSGQLFLVMEHVDGASLESILNETERLSPEEALRIAIQLSQALKHAHSQGIIHRDLKPANVMLDSKRNCKILDFGIAKLVNSSEIFGTLTKAGQLIGSPLYMSPEQLRGEAASELSDVYALGLLLFTMITGQPPFAGFNLMESLQQRLTESAPSLHPYVENPELCKGLDTIIARALHPDLDQRLANMAEFEAELSSLQAATANFADAGSGTELNPPVVVKRSKTTLLLLSTVTAVSVLGAFVFFSVSQQNGKIHTTKPKPDYSATPLPVNPSKVSKRKLLVENQEPLPGFKIGGAKKSFWIAPDPTTEDNLNQLKNSSVKHLSFADNKSFTAKMLTQLPSSLRALSLRNTTINDEDLKEVGKLTTLTWLNISNTAITDRGIQYLRPLSLHRLDLNGCKGISNHVIPELRKLPSLRNLHLSNSGVTRVGVIQLQKFPRLIRVGVGGLDVTDKDIIDFQHLTHIDLTGCKYISDRTLMHYMKRGTVLNVARCPKLSKKGLQMWHHAHPPSQEVTAGDVNALGDTFFDE